MKFINKMETMETQPKAENQGNTRPDSQPKQKNQKRPVPSKFWCFTYNNYKDDDIDKIIGNLNPKDKYIIGKEIGTENKIPHLQGFIKFNVKTRPLEKFNMYKSIHWEKCKGTEKQNIQYCMKDGEFVTNYEQNIIGELEPLDIIKNLKQWQKDIENIIKTKPDQRTIYWIYEYQGNVGKTQFAKYLSYHYGAIPLEGKKNDILYCAAQFNSKIYIYDLERSMEDYVSYASIEKIKNGYFMCSKYESKPIIRNSPHVIIFANFKPENEKLSKDRWMLYKIKNENIIKKNIQNDKKYKYNKII